LLILIAASSDLLPTTACGFHVLVIWPMICVICSVSLPITIEVEALDRLQERI